MAVPYGNLAPVDLIKQMTAANPRGFGLGMVNPPGLSPILKILGINEDPLAIGTNISSKETEKTNRPVSYPPNQSPTAGNVDLVRRPFMMTCQKWLESTDQKTPKYLYCRINPRSVQWTMNLRTSDQKTLAGMVQHAWRNNNGVRRRTFFSEPTISITFQSGNIMPVYPDKSADPNRPENQRQIAKGLEVFYRFVDLLGDSRIIESGGQRRANVVYIMYTSHVYPSMVLAGMFTPEGFTFTDSAENPNMVEWTASFTVYDSYPRFDNATMLINTWGDIQSHTKVPPSDAKLEQSANDDARKRIQAEFRNKEQERDAAKSTKDSPADTEQRIKSATNEAITAALNRI